jgi:hypothetical protein
VTHAEAMNIAFRCSFADKGPLEALQVLRDEALRMQGREALVTELLAAVRWWPEHADAWDDGAACAREQKIAEAAKRVEEFGS